MVTVDITVPVVILLRWRSRPVTPGDLALFILEQISESCFGRGNPGNSVRAEVPGLPQVGVSRC